MSKRTKRADDTGSKPWVSNYPPLAHWLAKIEARCQTQLPIGDVESPVAYMETWLTPNGRAFIVEVRANRMGWNIYTPADTSAVDVTLLDAEARLGLQ